MVQRDIYADFHRRLLRWYKAHGRHTLPWRNTDDAYAIYISEIMLQQTQVKTVLERYYAPFLAKFPSLQALADAPRDAVLKQWEGLGYYNRAANLHEAAKRAAPALPRTVEALEKLPGIGRNTAHAVAAFAYHAPVPVMEANVKRVLSRIFAWEEPETGALWEKAALLLDKRHPFDYNQAMMDLGAMLCTKRTPQCEACPAGEICEGRENPGAYPAGKQKKAVPVRRVKALVWQDARGHYLLAAREGAFLRGLFGFPTCADGTQTAYLQNHAFPLPKPIGSVSQTYSHFRQDADICLVRVGFAGDGEGWYMRQELDGLALAGIDHKIVEVLDLLPND